MILNKKNLQEDILEESKLNPEDSIENLLEKRKKEIIENDFYNRRDPHRITYLTELKNLKESLELIYDVAHEQRKIAEKIAVENQSTTVKQ